MNQNLSTGTGLTLLAAAIALHAAMGRSVVDQQAIASSPAGPAEPTVVGFAATTTGGDFHNRAGHYYHRLWSDGTIEILYGGGYDPFFGVCDIDAASPCPPASWKLIPNSTVGYACRPDIDGNRIVDAADLTLLLGAWGQAPSCQPLPTISCTIGEVN